MAKISGVASQLSGKVGQTVYRQTKWGTVVYEALAKASVWQYVTGGDLLPRLSPSLASLGSWSSPE